MNINDAKILYEDNHLLVVVKPPNMPAQADISGDADLLSELKSYIKQKYGKAGEVYLGLVHRLDRPVGGVMVFARTSKAAKRLNEQWRSGEVSKRYIAAVEGEAKRYALLSDYMKSGEDIRAQISDEEFDGAKIARLSYTRIGFCGGASLLDITLFTGRKHQIRAQLSYHGIPVLCDQRYNERVKKGDIALFAYALELNHPTKGERMSFVETPAGTGFSRFKNAINALPAYKKGYCVFADADMLIADKLAGVEVTRADAGEESLQAAFELCFGELYPVHRIDANTRGLVIFARKDKAKKELEALFAKGKIEKLYLAKVRGKPNPSEAVIEAYAKKDSANAFLTVRERKFEGAGVIKTGYKVLKSDDIGAQLELRLYTGKTHQIRAHMAHIGHPILGDDKYGDRELNKVLKLHTQMLTAYSLEFTWRGKNLRFTSNFRL